MAENRLNRFLEHAKPIQVSSQAPARCVPFGKARVPLKRITGVACRPCFGFPQSSFALPQMMQRLSVGRMARLSTFTRSMGEPFKFGNVTPDVGLPQRIR